MTGQGADTFGHLEHEDTYFELSPQQRQFFASLQYLNEYLRNQYHAVHVFLWKSGFAGQAGNMPPRYDSDISFIQFIHTIHVVNFKKNYVSS